MTLIEFYGEECPHCAAMEDKVERLEENEDVDVEQREVWHDEENAARQQELDDGKCGGVPYFINTDTGEYICGEAPYDELVAWATGRSAE
ncbi:MAG: hypothetical protein ABEK12_03010 [Candidatus Nanohaloarchaea archaeon]